MKKIYGWIQNILKSTIRLDRLDNLPTRYSENLVSIVFTLPSSVHEVVKVKTL